jgi:hypothetical protein
LVCPRHAETVSLQRRQICYRWGTPAYINDSVICRQGKKCKNHGDFPTEVSDMARNMKM